MYAYSYVNILMSLCREEDNILFLSMDGVTEIKKVIIV